MLSDYNIIVCEKNIPNKQHGIIVVGENRPGTKEFRRILREIDTPMILLYIMFIILLYMCII